MPTLDRSWFHCILYFVWMLVGEGLHGGETIGYSEFRKGMDSWTANPQIRNLQHSANGVSKELHAPDPFLTSPQVVCPAGKVVCMERLPTKSIAFKSIPFTSFPKSPRLYQQQ
jgi:hypothetical protein